MSRTKRARRSVARSVPTSLEPGQPGRWSRWLGAALLALTALVYAPSLGNGFTFDDPSVVTEASELLSRPALAGRVFTPDYFRLSGESTFRPTVTFTYIVDWQVGGGRAWAFHLQNVLWHVLTVGCLFVLLPRLGAGFFVRSAVAAIYAVHPALTEAVEGIAFREDVLVTALGLLGLLTITGTRPGSATLRLAIGAMFLVAALFAKESGLVFVALLPLTEWAIARQSAPAGSWQPSRHLSEYVALLCCVVAYLAVRFWLLPASESYGIRVSESLSHSAGTGVVAAGHYLLLFVYPHPLCADYRGVVAYVTSLTDWRVWLSFAALAGLTGLAWSRRHGSPVVVWGWAWFLISLVPVSNVVPIPTFMAERFLYLPCVGLVAFAVTVLVPRATWSWRAAATTAAIVCVFGALTWTRHRAWSSDEVLWRTTLDDFPSAQGALHGYGAALIESGRYVEAIGYLRRVLEDPGIGRDRRAVVARELGFAHISLGQVAEAITSYEDSLAATPTSMAHQNLALVLLRLDRLTEAETHMRAAIQLQPDEAESHSGLGAVLARQGRTDEAIAAYREAIRLRPTLAVAHANLGVALSIGGLTDDAIASLFKAIALDPEQPRWRYRVATLLQERGRTSEAIQQLEAALRIDPNDVEAGTALRELRAR
jgi:tetratricopeptide (TPR) repeat protein